MTVLGALLLAWSADVADGQTPPSSVETAAYRGLLAAASRGDTAQIEASREA